MFKTKRIFYTINLDMYKDAYSLPSLSENIMCKFSSIDFESTLNNTIPPLNDNIPKIYPSERIKDYITLISSQLIDEEETIR